MMIEMKNLLIYLLSAAALTAALTACDERHPENFRDISSVYFNNRIQGNVLCDSTDVTFVYESGDEMTVPVRVQLLGRTAEYDRPVEISVSSDNAVEGADYMLPEKSSVCLPAGATYFDYDVVLKRTEALRTGKKEIRLELHPNSHLYTSEEKVDFPGRRFRVDAVSGFGKKESKTFLSAVEKANLTVRNFPSSVVELRKKLKLKEGGDVYLFATTLCDGRRVLIKCTKV